MPTILFLFGLRFFFYSEEHLPIHIHVQSGDGRTKIDVITGEILDNKGVKPKDLKELSRRYSYTRMRLSKHGENTLTNNQWKAI